MTSQPEFDRYAAEGYSELTRDPIRDRFAGSRFFHERKLQLLRDFFRRRGVASKKLDWLDFGCGEGDLLALGKDRFHAAAGCDVSGGMIQKSSGAEIRQMPSARQIPFEDGSFDLVTAVCVYHHIAEADRSAVTAEILRVLRPGGFFCMIEHNPYNPVARMIVRSCPIDVDAHLLSAGTARHLAANAAMKILETRYFLYLPERLYARMPSLENLLASVPLGGQYAVFAQKTGA